MGLKGDEIALYLSGQPVPIKSCNIVIRQPTIKQIVAFKESDFLFAANYLGKPEMHIDRIRADNPEQLAAYTDFQIYTALIRQDPNLKRSVENFLTLVFPDYEISIEEEINFVSDGRKVGMINPFNYEDFKKIVKNLFLFTKVGEKEYNPANEKARKIAEKLRKGHEKISKMKADTNESATLFGSYVSILSIGMNMDINILYNYTPFQLYNVFIRYWRKVNSDFYQKVSTTPMMDVSKMEAPDDWSDTIY